MSDRNYKQPGRRQGAEWEPWRYFYPTSHFATESCFLDSRSRRPFLGLKGTWRYSRCWLNMVFAVLWVEKKRHKMSLGPSAYLGVALGTFLLPLGKGAAAECALGVFSLLPAPPTERPQAWQSLHSLLLWLKTCLPSHLSFGSSKTGSDCCAVPCREQPKALECVWDAVLDTDRVFSTRLV